jgi:hypothetical protein
MSNPLHGTRAKYSSGCRCDECRVANTRYQCGRRKQGWPRKVAAKVARRHIRKLARRGVGRRSVADAATISERTVGNIKAGRVKTIFSSTEKKILAITPAAVADNALVNAAPTLKKLNKLLNEGLTKKELARRLGSRAKVPMLQIKGPKIKARNEMKVDKFYRKLMAC